jgi:hypothetical protein
MDDILLGADGAPRDGVGHDFVNPEQLARFNEASHSLSRLRAPVMLGRASSHDHVFFVAFDGTGNNQFVDSFRATNVARIANDLAGAHRQSGGRVDVVYVVGPGTEGDWLKRTSDSATGSSYPDKINYAYQQLAIVANKWRTLDPDARIHVQGIGFSRGASQLAGFTNLVHDRGIPDFRSKSLAPDGSVVYTRNLVEPGMVPQMVGLFDPVATGAPMRHDRRLPASVVSAFQITAETEFRASFPSDQIIPPGLSADGRFLNILVPGAHSDVGGGYLRNGLSIRCGNLMRDYCNAAWEQPLLHKEYEPLDKRLNVIHHSTRGELIFHLDPRVGVRGMPSGTNTVLAPEHVLTDAQRPPVSTLDHVLPMRQVPIGPANPVPMGVINFRADPAALAAEARGGSYGRAAMGFAATVATAVDFEKTRESATSAAESGNTTGAVSQVLHYGGRNVGGLAGASLFASAAGAAGVESGPGALVAAGIGAVVGAAAGERLMDAYDRHRIYRQTDEEGNAWQLDPSHGWSRHLPALPDSSREQIIKASPELARRLTFQANITAAELALARDSHPRDPYTQSPEPQDARTMDGAPWLRSAETGQWSRHVMDERLEHGLSRSHIEVATPQRAAELDARAEATIQENVAQSPLGVAERFVAAYEREGWQDLGKVPPAVQHALLSPTDKVLASDGQTYAHESEGRWISPGIFRDTVARGGLRDELDRTEAVSVDTRRRADAELASIDRVTHMDPHVPSRLDDPAHPDHALFKEARMRVAEIDRRLDRSPDQHTDNLASALTVQARKDGLSRIDQVALSEDGNTLWAVQTPPGRRDHLFDIQTKVPTAEAMTPMEQSAAKWPESMQRFQSLQQEAMLAKQQAQDQQQQEGVRRGRSL